MDFLFNAHIQDSFLRYPKLLGYSIRETIKKNKEKSLSSKAINETTILLQVALLQIRNSPETDKNQRMQMTARLRFERFAVRFTKLAYRDLAARS